jgi:hypothetical protein
MARVREKKIKFGDDEDITQMFNSMIGVDGVDVGIAHNKYLQLKYGVNQFFKVMDLFTQVPMLAKSAEFAKHVTEITNYCSEAPGSPYSVFFGSADLFDRVGIPGTPDEVIKTFLELYEKLKASDFLNNMIIACDKLAPYKRFLEVDKSILFLQNMPGVSFFPLPFTKLNFKDLYVHNINNAPNKLFLLSLLGKVFKITFNIWNILQTPDVNIEALIEIMRERMDQLLKIPELSRCQRAVATLKKSIEMLKTNFNTYYRDFIQTKNSSIIMEHYIGDVIKTTKADADLRRQFMAIIKYYRKISQAQYQTPQSKELFEKIEKTFKHFSRNTTNLGKETGDNSDDESEELDDVFTDTQPEEPTEEMLARINNANKTVDQLVAEIEGKKILK